MQQLNFSTFYRLLSNIIIFLVLLRALNLNVLNFSTFKDEGEPCHTQCNIEFTMNCKQNKFYFAILYRSDSIWLCVDYMCR